MTSMHPDSLRDEQQQLVGHLGWRTTGGTGPGSRTQPWRFTERANAPEGVEGQSSEDALQFYETLSLHGLVTS